MEISDSQIGSWNRKGLRYPPNGLKLLWPQLPEELLPQEANCRNDLKFAADCSLGCPRPVTWSGVCSDSCPAVKHFIRMAGLTAISANTQLLINNWTRLPLSEDWSMVIFNIMLWHAPPPWPDFPTESHLAYANPEWVPHHNFKPLNGARSKLTWLLGCRRSLPKLEQPKTFTAPDSRFCSQADSRMSWWAENQALHLS